MRTKFSTVFTSLMLCAALSFSQACKSQVPPSPDGPTRIAANEDCKRAIDVVVSQMLDQVRRNYGGALPRDLQIAFHTVKEIGPYMQVTTETTFTDLYEVTQQASIREPLYIRNLDRAVQRRVLDEAEGSFLVFDEEVFAMMLEELELNDAMQVVKPANMARLREQSEAMSTKPLDAICLIKVAGEQVQNGLTDFNWDIEVRLVDATAAATMVMAANAAFIAQEDVGGPLEDIHKKKRLELPNPGGVF